jgi:hypothetical protein
MEIIFILGICGWLIFLSRRLKVNPFYLPFLSVNLLVAISYVFAIAGQLKLALPFVGLTGILVFVWILFTQRKTLSLKSHLNPNFFSLLSLYGVIFFFLSRISGDFRFATWDEFPTWAYNSKIIAVNQRLWISSDHNPFKSYPPGENLFHYIFNMGNGWSEANALRAQLVWVLFCILATVGALKSSNYFNRIFFFLFVIYIFYSLYFSFDTILADGLLAMQLAAIIAIVSSEKKPRPPNILLAAPLFVLPIIKPTGIVFSFIAIIVFISIILVNHQTGKDSHAPTRQIHTRKYYPNLQRRKSTLLIFLLFATPLISSFTWRLYLSSKQVRATQVPPNWDWLLDSSEHNFRLNVLKSFVQNFNRPLNEFLDFTTFSLFGQLRLFHFLILLIVIHLMSTLYTQESRFSELLKVIFFYIGIAIYLIGLYVAYILVGTRVDALNTSAFARYFNTILLVWIVIVLLKCSNVFRIKTTSPINLFFIALVSIFLLSTTPANLSRDISSIQADSDLTEQRKSVETFVEKLPILEKNAKLYFVDQESKGFSKYVFAYLMSGHEVNWWCWSLGRTGFYEGDVWTCDRSINEILSENDYLIVYQTNNQLNDQIEKYLIENESNLVDKKRIFLNGRFLGDE